VLTAVRTDMGDFLGLSHMAGKKSGDILVVSGAYSWVRHPLYSFGFVMIWSAPRMTAGAMALSIAASLYLWLGTYHEEAGLRHIFGEQYIRYAEEVPRLIPSRPRRRR
ncbi:MAG: isoprenylcysteine carboxylmethyltransferase family protein, partial [Spirochaetaceae bacterium]|nr:isoprenylcysteine carboxylmethyltransferase family protein [Spirochaetaceae bacterium]